MCIFFVIYLVFELNIIFLNLYFVIYFCWNIKFGKWEGKYFQKNMEINYMVLFFFNYFIFGYNIKLYKNIFFCI